MGKWAPPLANNFLGKPLLGEKYVEGRRKKKKEEYRVRQEYRTPPSVHQGITIWVDEIEFEKK